MYIYSLIVNECRRPRSSLPVFLPPCFTAKKLGGAVGSCTYIYSLIVNVCRRPRSSLPVRYVNHTIIGNKHLFQNGRALLKCRSFILLHVPSFGIFIWLSPNFFFTECSLWLF
jgi:hypothetical protein